jgi:hypothetical protein
MVIGRPRKAALQDLLSFESLWVDTFRGLRDGNPEVVALVPPPSGVFMQISGQGRETLHLSSSNQKPRTIREPKFSTSPAEKRQWKSRVSDERERFENDRFAIDRATVRPIPSERSLWEALKRAQTASQVRRICSRSKIWLKPRLEFPDGSFMEYWPWRRVLYRDAEKFCHAKRDPRYPERDKRKSGDYRRLEFLARVLAGLTVGLASSTAVEVLRKAKHPEECTCWRCRAQIAPRYDRTLTKFLTDGDWFR